MLDQHLLALSATKVTLNVWVTIYHTVLRGREGTTHCFSLRRPCPRGPHLAAVNLNFVIDQVRRLGDSGGLSEPPRFDPRSGGPRLIIVVRSVVYACAYT